MTGRAKWDAWQHTGEELSKADKLDDADDLYVDLVKSLGWEQGNSESTAQDQGGASKGMVSVSTMAAESEPVPEPGERCAVLSLRFFPGIMLSAYMTLEQFMIWRRTAP